MAMSPNGKRLAIGGCLLVLLGLAAWLVLDRSPGSPATMPPASPNALAAPAAEDRAGVAALPGASRPAGPTIRPRDADAVGSRAASDLGTVRVFVYDSADGRPVADAAVDATDEEGSGAPWTVTSPFGSTTTLAPSMPEFGDDAEHVVTDAGGMATIRSRPELVVMATRADLFGLRRWTKAPKGEIRVPVTRSWPVAARVVGDDGAPVGGIPVVLRRIFDLRAVADREGGLQSLPGIHQDVTVTSRDADGLAVLQMWSSGPPAKGVGDTLSAWVKGYEVDAVQAPFHQLRNGPLTLKLPQVASLRVTLVDSAGAPFRNHARVFVGPGPIRPPLVVPDPAIEADASGGLAHFRFVPVGLPLSVVALADGWEPAVADLGAVAAASTTQSLSLRLGRARSVLTGRLVDASGTALKSRQVGIATVSGEPSASVAAPPVRSTPRRIRTDQDGGFRLEAPPRAVAARGGIRLELEIRDASDLLTHSGAITVAAIGDGPETQLGDVKMSPPSILVAGRVVDELGAPVAGAIVSADVHGSLRQGAVTKGWGSRGDDILVPRAEVQADASGTFSIALPAAGSGWDGKLTAARLFGEHPGYVQIGGPRLLDPGMSDVVLVLTGAGTIEGTMIGPGFLDLARVRMAVSGPALTKPIEFPDCVDSGGRFRLEGVPAGVVTLAIHRPGKPAPVVTFEGIEVPRVGVAGDPRLRAIDLGR